MRSEFRNTLIQLVRRHAITLDLAQDIVGRIPLVSSDAQLVRAFPAHALRPEAFTA